MQMRIYHTNDIHGNLEFLRRVQAWLALNRGENDFFFDSGDYMDLKSIVVQADRGESAMKLMAVCGLDAMTVGNNEIDLGSEALERLTAFPLIGTNIVHNDATAIPGLPGSRILERCGKRFLILGLSPYYKPPMVAGGYNVFFEMGNLHTIEPVAAARAELDRQRGKYDFCIALSHSGNPVDLMICRQLPEVDFWLEGHCHSIITEKRFTQSGMGETLGELTLEIDETGISCIASRQIELPDAETESFSALVRQTQERADAILSSELETVGELAFDPLKESPLTNFLCDSLRKHFGGDLALMHSGISEKALTRPVSRRSLIETFPSKLNPTIYRLSGQKILEAVRLSLDEDHIRQSGKGAGFRGHILGCLGFSCNVTLCREPFGMCIDGIPVEPEKLYTVVTDDYLQRGTGYPSLAVPDDQAKFDKWFIRDLVQHSLMDAELFRTAAIPRERGNEHGI